MNISDLFQAHCKTYNIQCDVVQDVKTVQQHHLILPSWNAEIYTSI